MCGRYTIFTKTEKLAAHFDANFSFDDFTAKYNAAPGQELPIITSENIRLIHGGHWGFPITIAKKDREIINIRSESVMEKPFFGRLLAGHRCVVLADGFFEWKAEKRGKIPYRIARKDNSPFAFAGLFVRRGVSNQFCFAILTTTPNKLMAPVHNRMPVILEDHKTWLEKTDNPKVLFSLLALRDNIAFEAYEVSRLVNNTRNDSPRIIEAV